MALAQPSAAWALAGLHQLDLLRPTLRSVRPVVGQVIGVPGEAVAEGEPIDAELATHLLLADVPVAGLDELDDRDVPVASECANHHAEG